MIGTIGPRRSRHARSRWPVIACTAVVAVSSTWGLLPTSATVQAQTTPTTSPPLPAAPASSWAIIPSPDTSSSETNVLTSVSCTAGPACMAVGHVFGASDRTLAESWDGSAWSIVPSPNSSTSQQNYLDGVSCLSSTECTAVGSFITGQGDETLVETWDGSTWSIVPSPNVGYLNDLLAVSCTSASTCTAVGSSRPRSGFDRALVETWDGRAWSVVASPDASSSTNVLNDVSCPSAAQCVAVGTFYNGTELQLLSMSGDGSTWALLPNPGRHIDGTGVTCSSARKAAPQLRAWPRPPRARWPER